jgi:probable addiction module antidote protein
MKLKSFDDFLMQDLQDPEFAAAYLTDAYQDSLEEFLVALRKLVQANGGMSVVAAKSGITREALYRMLSETGNPEFRSIYSVLKAIGINTGFHVALSVPREKELLSSA